MKNPLFKLSRIMYNTKMYKGFAEKWGIGYVGTV